VKGKRSQLFAASIAVSCSVLLPLHSFATDSGDVRTRAEQSFNQLKQPTENRDSSKAPSGLRHEVENRNSYSDEHYLFGKGQGNMAKGAIMCQRVSELSARTDLAKQIRILVKEHMVDRIRERTGLDAAQDIEVTREEIVQEYLQGVKIIDRKIDEGNKICSATAVMPKIQIQPKQTPDETSRKP
jgi:hypothetical protein